VAQSQWDVTGKQLWTDALNLTFLQRPAVQTLTQPLQCDETSRGSLTCGGIQSMWKGTRKRPSASGKLAAVGLGDGSPAVQVTSLQHVSERVRTVEDTVVELAEELARQGQRRRRSWHF
jgi:hypothetical protein